MNRREKNIMDHDKERVLLQQTLYESKNPTRKWLHNIRKDWIISKIYQYKRPEKGISLEVGPGAGIYIPILDQVSDRLIVSDLEIDYLAYISQLYKNRNIQIIEDDITCTKILPGSMDLILFTEVIEHIKDSRTALHNLYRLLKPGGVLILSSPQKYSPLEIFSKIAYLPFIIDVVRHVYREPVHETGHVNLMTEKILKKQILDAGFNIIEQHKSGLYIPLIAEFFGQKGLAWECKLEKNIMGSCLDVFLWTQYYIVKK